MNTTELIINKAMNICKTDFMQYPDYDESTPLTLADALAIIVTHDEEHDTKLEHGEVFDLIDNAIEGTPVKLGEFDFQCSKCDKIHTKPAYAIAQATMGVALIHTCDCGNKTDL